MQKTICGSQSVVDVRRRSPDGQAGIQPHPVGKPIKTGACGGGITIVISDPLGYITHQRIGITILVDEATVDGDIKANVINAIKNRVDGVLSKQGGIGAIILYQMITGFDTIFIIAMQVDECGVAIGIAANPAVDPEHLGGAETCGVAVGSAGLVESIDALENQTVEPVGGHGAPLDLGPGDVGGQPGVGHDRLDNAIKAGVGGGQIGLEGRQPTGHIREQGIVGAVLVGEAGPVGAERKAEVVDPVLNGVDQGAAVKQAVAAVALDLMEAGGRGAVVVAVQGEELGQACGVVAHPAVQGDDVGNGELRLVEAAGGLQPLDQQLVEPIDGGDACGDGRSLVGAGQAAIACIPGDQLIQASARAADRRGEVGGVGGTGGGDGDHGRNGFKLPPCRIGNWQKPGLKVD